MEIRNDTENRKLKGGRKNMKKILVVGTIFAISLMMISTFALAMTPKISGNVANIFGEEETIDEFGDLDSIDSIDVYEVEQEVEIESEKIESGESSFKSRKMTMVQGFAYNDEDNTAAFVSGLLLNAKVITYENDDPEVKSLTKGKLKIAGTTFDVKRTDEPGKFELVGPKGQEGFINANLVKTYNQGRIGVWKGVISITGGERSFEGTIEFQTKGKLLRPDPRPGVDPVEVIKTFYSGSLELDGGTYKFESAGNSGARELNAYIYGENEEQGKFSIKVVERNDDDTRRTWNGKIVIQSKDGTEEIIYGEVVVVTERDSSDSKEWVGKITVTGIETNFEIIGDILLFEETTKTTKPEKSLDIDQEYGRSDNEEAGRSIDTIVKNRGLFAKIKEFFGIDN